MPWQIEIENVTPKLNELIILLGKCDTYTLGAIKTPLKINCDIGYRNAWSSGKRIWAAKHQEKVGLEPHLEKADRTWDKRGTPGRRVHVSRKGATRCGWACNSRMKTWVKVSRETQNMRTNYIEPKTQTGIWPWREKEGNEGLICRCSQSRW